MINLSELRLGNLYLDSDGITYKKVDSIEPYRVYWAEDIEPIQLTPSVLSAFGINRDSTVWYLSSSEKLYDPLQLLSSEQKWVQPDTKIFAYIHNGHMLSCGIKYMHILQNIFFDLTGKELLK